jgi:hypothetical protein
MPLTLTDNQLSDMRKQMDGHHCLPGLVAHMRQNYGNEPVIAGLDDAQLTAKVRRCMHQAWDLNLFSETDVFTFTAYDLVCFPGCGQHPQVRNILEAPTTSPHTRMLSLDLNLTASDWDRIKQECELFAAETGDAP